MTEPEIGYMEIMTEVKQRLDEPNQMLCMAMIAGDEYVKLWANHNPKWAQSIIEYWGGWRNELELAHLMIHKVQSILA